MNRYPVWLNLLLLGILMLGSVLALPNLYGSAPAVQLANIDGSGYNESRLPEIVRILESDQLGPEASYVEDGRAVLRFHSVEEQQKASVILGERLQREASVALTLAPKLPAWLREFGLQPMSLGLDLRGGVHFLLEVDMEAALTTRLESYRESLSDLLRDAEMRNRVDLSGQTITVRLTDEDDADRARDLIRESDPELLVMDGSDARTFRVRMSDQQVRERQDFAIEQNITTLRNRVNQLGVSEPLVQRQGIDR
ncbi:MAG: protein translocase subunit SecD, partial [Woeseia sp.]